MLHVVCAQLHPGHLSVRIRDSSRCSMEIVKNHYLQVSVRLLLLLVVVLLLIMLTHRVLITCNMLCAMWYKGTAELSSLPELKSH